MQAAGQRRPLRWRAGWRILRPGAEGTTSTTCSRAPASPTTCSGNGRDVMRGGWGIYHGLRLHQLERAVRGDRRQRPGHGPVFSVNNTDRHPQGGRHVLPRRRSDLDDRQPERGRTRHKLPLFGQVASPRLQQPYTRQANIGWAHQLSASTALTVDYVHIDGRDINMRFRYNYRDSVTGLRRLADLAIRPNTLAVPTPRATTARARTTA